MKLFAWILAASWAGFWFTPDQQGRRHFQRGEFREAARDFEDPLWEGTSWYRSGEFEKAAAAFARRDTAEAHFNRGNALVMRGEYDSATAAYDRALEKRSDWKEAEENRELARARGEAIRREGADIGDQKVGADRIQFDNRKRATGQDTEGNREQAALTREIQALWLRRVQTRPADFLRAKFSYQEAMRSKEGRNE